MIFIGPKAAYTGIPSARQGGKGNAARNRVKRKKNWDISLPRNHRVLCFKIRCYLPCGGGEDFDYVEFYRGL
ncbi:hypothetical protein M422DRAFT_26246, partial [Sphaerobolus stellatus SS14]